MDDHHKFTAHFIVLPGKLCLQATLFTFMSGRRRKIPPSSKGERGKREWGVKIMGPTQCALFHTFCYVWSKRSPNSLCVCSSSCSSLCLSFSSSSSSPPAVFLREQQGLVALAALHSSTLLRLQITHFCHHCYSRKFGEVKGHHFSLLSSVSSIILAGQCACTHPADDIRFNNRHFLSSNAESFSHLWIKTQN